MQFAIWGYPTALMLIGAPAMYLHTKFNCCVYWIHTKDHINWNDGYIGVSIDPTRRLIEHTRGLPGRNKRVTEEIHKNNDNVICDILYFGTEESCYDLEKVLRPVPYIGWNKASGGRRCLSNGLKGIKKSTPAWNKGLKTNIKTTALRWKIIELDTGQEEVILSLRQWCTDMGFSYQSIHANFANKNKPYKGYQIILA